MLLRKRFFPPWHDAGHFTLTIGLIPLFYYFEVFVVLPSFHYEWNAIYIFHIFMSIFLLHNVTGNMLGGMVVDTSILGRQMPPLRSSTWRFCSVCESAAPPRSWHCSVCNICILKRDHHCSFFGCCVGHLNQRYFFMFVSHIFVSTVYAFILNVQYVYTFIKFDSYFALLKFLFPLATLAYDLSAHNIYITIVAINFIVVCFTGFLLCYHLKLILSGMVTPESKEDTRFDYDYGWKSNLLNVFGPRWYLIWISPLFSSPLPNDGITWIESPKII